MKQRSREINVFSVSALDLFASALGAFILMSLIFMVFFTVTQQNAQQAEPVQAAVQQCDDPAPIPVPQPAQCDAVEATLRQCEARVANSIDASALAQCEATRAAVAEELRQARIPHLDVVICLDITGSMRDQIQGLKLEIADLADVLDRLTPSAGIGVVAYGDVRHDQVIFQHPIVETSTMDSLGRFVASLEPSMGLGGGDNPDNPEALDTALRVAVGMSWRSQSERRFIIVITDAPAYPHEEATAIARANSFAQVANQHVSTVMVRSSDHERFLRELARSGRGEFVNAVGGQSMIASILLAIIDV